MDKHESHARSRHGRSFRVVRSMRTPAAVLAFSIVATIFLALAPSSRAGRQVCEEWRDYLYNVETGEFIEWVGDPYLVCFEVGQRPKGIPRPPRGQYKGGHQVGVGLQSIISDCQNCDAVARGQRSAAQTRMETCRDEQRSFAKRQCSAGEHNGSPRTAPIPEILDDPRQQICKKEKVCIKYNGRTCTWMVVDICKSNPNYGVHNYKNPDFTSCVDAWLDGKPGTSSTTSTGGATGTLGYGPISVTVPGSDGHSMTVSVPAGTGLNSVCMANYQSNLGEIDRSLNQCKADVRAKAKRAEINYQCY